MRSMRYATSVCFGGSAKCVADTLCCLAVIIGPVISLIAICNFQSEVLELFRLVYPLHVKNAASQALQAFW